MIGLRSWLIYIYIHMHCIYIYTHTYDICLFAYLPIWENLRHWKLPKVFNLFLTSSLLGCTSEWIQSLQIFQTYPILGKLKRPLNQWLVFGGCISSIHVYVYVHTYHNFNHLLTGSCTSKWRSRAENWQVALLLNAAARAPRRLGMANLQEAMIVPIYFDGFRIVTIQNILEVDGLGVDSDGWRWVFPDCISENHQVLCSLRSLWNTLPGRQLNFPQRLGGVFPWCSDGLHN